MIDAIIQNLEKGKYLLNHISNEEYTNKSIAPYYSSIGGHTRHILDVFNCVLIGIENNFVDLTLRERNLNIENDISQGVAYYDRVIHQLEQIPKEFLKKDVLVSDDLGTGKEEFKTTLGGILAQAQSHAIHHYATLGYMLHQLNVCLPTDCFGVNPTTPKQAVLKDK
ncbi:DinB family protein [Wenyingzhuangia sp. IMCC45574]